MYKSMVLGGFIPTTMLDWKGKIAAVIFTSGCNFKCGYCHNHALAEGKTDGVVSWSSVEDSLRSRMGWLDGVVVTGGEPTIYSSIGTLLSRIKSLGLKVKLDTNGSNPEVLEALIKSGLIDGISMDFKASFCNYEKAARVKVDLKKIEASLNLILISKIEKEFRMTMVPELNGFSDLKELSSLLYGVGDCSMVIQQFNPEGAWMPEFRASEPYSGDQLIKWSNALKSIVRVDVRGVRSEEKAETFEPEDIVTEKVRETMRGLHFSFIKT